MSSIYEYHFSYYKEISPLCGTDPGERKDKGFCRDKIYIPLRSQIVYHPGFRLTTGATMLRGGAFKPRTSPYSFQGMEEEGLILLRDARDVTGLPIVTEILSGYK